MRTAAQTKAFQKYLKALVDADLCRETVKTNADILHCRDMSNYAEQLRLEWEKIEPPPTIDIFSLGGKRRRKRSKVSSKKRKRCVRSLRKKFPKTSEGTRSFLKAASRRCSYQRKY